MKDNDSQKIHFLTMGGTARNLALVSLETRKKLAKVWTEPRIGLRSENATYRFINYLDETGLLPASRNGNKAGWRKFSIRDYIYLDIVVALRKFNVKAEQIRPVFEVFSQPYNDDGDAKKGKSDWLDIMISVNAGDEIELIIDEELGTVFFDPLSASIYATDSTEGMLRVSISKIMNKFRKANGLKEIEVKKSFGDIGLYLSKSEMNAVLDMRKMSEKDVLTLVKKKKGLLSTLESDADIDENTAEKINSIIPEEYASVSAVKRDKEVVNLKTSTTNLYED